METQLAVAGDVEVMAETPQEMKEANQTLIQWCDQKIKQLRIDHIELEAAYKSAKEKKWKHTTLERAAKLARARVEFYRKIKTALEYGFYIVPSFPVTAFAIRTDREKPLKLLTTSQWHTHEQKNLSPLPEGEGEYKNPFPSTFQREFPGEKDGKGNPVKTQYWAESFQELDFPINMAKPRIMEAVNRAMAIKLFDDFGVLPSPHRKVDPIIVGRIKDPRKPGYGEGRSVSFIIAWALNTKSL